MSIAQDHQSKRENSSGSLPKLEKMLVCTCKNEDMFSSEKKMEGEGELKTLECLRGRLVAERAASRVAKLETELMDKKLVELEKQLRMEIKSMNKAEKRLKSLNKKCETLNINLAYSNSSDNLESSCGSSSTKQSKGNQNSIDQFSESDKCSIEEIMKNASETELTSTSSEETLNNANSEHIVDHLENLRKPDSIHSYGDSNNDDHSLKSLMGVVKGMEINGGNDMVDHLENLRKPESIHSCEDSNNDGGNDSVDNSMALVLVPPSQEVEMKMVNKSVFEVLEALKLAKEKLQSSMDSRRHVIKFGSIGTKIC